MKISAEKDKRPDLRGNRVILFLCGLSLSGKGFMTETRRRVYSRMCIQRNQRLQMGSVQ